MPTMQSYIEREKYRESESEMNECVCERDKIKETERENVSEKESGRESKKEWVRWREGNIERQRMCEILKV